MPKSRNADPKKHNLAHTHSAFISVFIGFFMLQSRYFANHTCRLASIRRLTGLVRLFIGSIVHAMKANAYFDGDC